ncbi:MAG: ATP-binding protein [Thermodesulfovibrio sp.]|nr:ATP-binding protein [Thermodesulfovibrio sp.]MCX7724713.1 ATP-binding protein [Thermodesulfovibrio sp.]MDW7971904.1 ATP-binding protein [Thermodesulfovibrio sp.]
MLNNQETIKNFLLEADDYLNILIEGVEELEIKGYNKETLESLSKVAYALKNSASNFNFNKIVTVSQKLEELFKALLNEEIKYDKSFVYQIKNEINLIETMINEIYKSGKENSEIKSLIKHEPIIFKTLLGKDRVRVSLSLIEKVYDSLGEILVQKNLISDREKILLDIVGEISDKVEKLTREINNFSNSLRVQKEKQKIEDILLDDFKSFKTKRNDENLIFPRKIKEITNDMKESIESLSLFSENLLFHLKSLNRQIDYLKEILVEISMIPIGILLYKVSEAIKEKAKEIGKKVEIDIKGTEIMIDKTIFESLYEPIFCILLNSIQHGIEFPQERVNKGKEREGHIKIEAKRQGNYVTISIKDDGKGIDAEKIKEKAILDGLISAEEASFMSQEDIFSYIFVPGFLTSDDIQGDNGKELYNVKKLVSKINGKIEVLSELDKGTNFIIKLPQSLTLRNLLVFKSNNLDFAVPIDYIEEVLMVEDFPQAFEDGIIRYKNKETPVRVFSEIFLSLNAKNPKNGYIIVFNFSGIRKALIVDEILGHEETIVHSFGDFLKGLTQYFGYFISSKGTPVYVVNPLNLFE